MRSDEVSNNDEQILSTQDDASGEKPTPFLAERMKTAIIHFIYFLFSWKKLVALVFGKKMMRIINKEEAPLEESKFKVMLELTGVGSSTDRPGLDLVMVLDLSESMGGDKLAKMKIAMQFVIKKLSTIDRLSVVTFAGGATRLCSLRKMTEDSQREIGKKVNALFEGGGTNITAGLQMGLKVLNDRSFSSGRVAAIMLMSDGDQNIGGDASQVSVGSVPVYTFGFGSKSNPKVLKAIADNSMGGTFSDVQNPKFKPKAIADNSMEGTFTNVENQDNLSIAFSQCLAGLLTVAVQDLKVTVTPKESTIIQKVSAGNYPQYDDAGSKTIVLGDLYHDELRKVMVDLLLPTAISPAPADVLQITYRHRASGGEVIEANPLIVAITRTLTSVEPEREEVMIEENRLRTAQVMRQARFMADDDKLEDARDMIIEAQSSLEDVVNEPNPLIEMLKHEVRQLLKLMKSPKVYRKQGHPFALSSETSHDRQRFATRGDVEKLRLFATPCMDTFLEQAKSSNEDLYKQKTVANLLFEFLNYYLQVAVKFPLRLFATQRKDTYLEQAKSSDEDSNKPPLTLDEDEDAKQEDRHSEQANSSDEDAIKPLRTLDEDAKQEVAADPLASLLGFLSYYIQMAIQFPLHFFEQAKPSDEDPNMPPLTLVEDVKQDNTEHEELKSSDEDRNKPQLTLDEDGKQEVVVGPLASIGVLYYYIRMAIQFPLRLFVTPRVDTRLEQARSSDEDPNKPLVTLDEDVKQEVVGNPLGSFFGFINYHLQMAIQFLKWASPDSYQTGYLHIRIPYPKFIYGSQYVP